MHERSKHSINTTELPTTFFTFDQMKDDLRFPSDVSGMKILDIGSGLSNAVATLRENGALAIGIDLRYSNRAELLTASQKTIQRAVSGLTDKTVGDRILFTMRLTETKNAALQDLNKHPESYVAASMFALPFADNTFDLTFSFCCLGQTSDQTNFFLALAEALRVTKPGGEVQVSPFEGQELKQFMRELSHLPSRVNITTPKTENGLVRIRKQK